MRGQKDFPSKKAEKTQGDRLVTLQESNIVAISQHPNVGLTAFGDFQAGSRVARILRQLDISFETAFE